MNLEGKKLEVRERTVLISWKTRSDFCICSNGTLAGSYGYL